MVRYVLRLERDASGFGMGQRLSMEDGDTGLQLQHYQTEHRLALANIKALNTSTAATVAVRSFEELNLPLSSRLKLVIEASWDTREEKQQHIVIRKACGIKTLVLHYT